MAAIFRSSFLAARSSPTVSRLALPLQFRQYHLKPETRHSHKHNRFRRSGTKTGTRRRIARARFRRDHGPWTPKHKIHKGEKYPVGIIIGKEKAEDKLHQPNSTKQKLKPKSLVYPPPPPPPNFRTVFGRFQKLTHPDFFLEYPKEARINEENLATLNNIISIIRLKDAMNMNTTGYPDAGIYPLKFYIKTEDEPRLVKINLRLSGGRCPRLLKGQLEGFFKFCGIAQHRFLWQNEHWPLSDEREEFILEREKKQKKKK